MGVLRDSGSTNFNLPGIREAERPRDAFLEAVQEVAAGEYEVFGEIGRGKEGSIVYLARDLADKKLIVLRLTQGAGAGDEYSLEVVKQLDASVPAPESACPSCGAPAREWGRFCSMCGSDLWGDPSVSGDYSKEELLGAVKEAARGKFEILGEIPRAEGGGFVYFGRDLSTGKLSALRLLKEEGDEYSLGRTGVLKRLARDVAPKKPSAPPPPPPRPPKPTTRTPSPEPFPLGSPPPEPTPLDSFGAPPSPISERRARPQAHPEWRPTRPPGPGYYDRWEQALEFLRQPLVLAIIAVAVVIVLVALCVAITPSTDSAARLGPPSDAARPETREPVSLASELPEESVLGYSVAIASFRTLNEALARQRELTGLETTVYVAPTIVRGSVYYRLLSGLLPRRDQAEALMSRLVESGVKDVGRDWDVRPTGLAFRFGTYPSIGAADDAVGRLARQGIPAYRVPAASADGVVAYYVYAGGYERPDEGRHLREQIIRAGLEADLVERSGLVR
ncbi:MAG: SPOR domain-containing protein [Gemmatimonadota bacterium]|nr:MAG: SPOR domain-containing protein [Gemmatimonadota bacterium]